MPTATSSRPRNGAPVRRAIPKRSRAPSRSPSAAASRSTNWPINIRKKPRIPGLTPQQALEKLTWEGAAERYPEGVPDKVRRMLRHELRLIETAATTRRTF